MKTLEKYISGINDLANEIEREGSVRNSRSVVNVLRNTAEFMKTLEDPADLVDSGNIQARQLDQLVGLAQAITGRVSDKMILFVPKPLEVGEEICLEQEEGMFKIRRDV